MTSRTLFIPTRPGWLISLWLAAICLTTAALADSPIFNTENGKAVAGYDVVSYFTEEAPQPGDPANAVMWKGAIWQFASRHNRERFEANPRAYAPQYGGYCAFGMSRGRAVGSDPTLFQIREGKLYLIHNKAAWGRWIADVAGYIAEADSNWPSVLAAR